MGHLAADLDPLGLSERKVHKELRPETYGFTEADLDRPIFIDKVLGLEMATVREILKILRRTYCRHIGVEFMHITSPAQKSWIQERIEGRDKDIAFTRRGQAGDPQQADRGGGLREVRRRQVHRHQALRPRRRGGDGAGARADHQARRPARHQGDRDRHGASRAPQRARQRHGQAAPRHLQRVQGRLVQARRRRGLGRRQVSPRRLVRPFLRRQQRAPLAHRQPLAPRDRRSGGARQGARQAGPARLQAGRAHARAAAADPRRCRLRRPGRGGGVLRAVGPQGPPHRRLDPLHHQQPDRLHHEPALFALLALLLGRGQDGGGADLPRERRQSGSRRARRQDRHRVPAAVPEARRHRHVLLPPARPQRVRRAGLHPAADVPGDQVAPERRSRSTPSGWSRRASSASRKSRVCRPGFAPISTRSWLPPKVTGPTRRIGSTAAGPRSASPRTRRGAARPASPSRR